MKRLILMQGAPGCGKSTMAETILRDTLFSGLGLSADIFSADDYWYQVNKPEKPDEYSWDTSLSGKNHVWNQQRVLKAMQDEMDVIIVDNTNTLRKEAAPYIVLAQMYGYSVEAVRCDPGVDVCVARQSNRPEDRRVPEEVIRAMHARMENLLPLFS